MKKKINFDHVMGLLILFGAIFVFCNISCKGQTNTSIPNQDYNDASGEIFDIPGILFYADGIVDFVYCTQDDEFIIEYNDQDAFDPDNLPKTVNCVQGDSGLVCLYCSEDVFFECLEWYSNLCNENQEFYEPSNKYYIKEVYLDDDDYDEPEYRYYKLVKI